MIYALLILNFYHHADPHPNPATATPGDSLVSGTNSAVRCRPTDDAVEAFISGLFARFSIHIFVPFVIFTCAFGSMCVTETVVGIWTLGIGAPLVCSSVTFVVGSDDYWQFVCVSHLRNRRWCLLISGLSVAIRALSLVFIDCCAVTPAVPHDPSWRTKSNSA